MFCRPDTPASQRCLPYLRYQASYCTFRYGSCRILVPWYLTAIIHSLYVRPRRKQQNTSYGVGGTVQSGAHHLYLYPAARGRTSALYLPSDVVSLPWVVKSTPCDWVQILILPPPQRHRGLNLKCPGSAPCFNRPPLSQGPWRRKVLTLLRTPYAVLHTWRIVPPSYLPLRDFTGAFHLIANRYLQRLGRLRDGGMISHIACLMILNSISLYEIR